MPANILTDDAATYAANPEISGTKTNNTPRVPSDSDTWITAQWGTFTDLSSKLVNQFFQGDAAAGKAGKTSQLLGSFSVAEKAAFAGAVIGDTADNGIAVGDKTVASNGISLQALTTSTLRFASASEADNASLSVLHSSGDMTVRAGNTNMAIFTASSFEPFAHLGQSLGDAAKRWGSGYIDQLFAGNIVEIGAGTAAVDLKLRGGSSGGQEPKISFINGTTVAATMTLQTGAVAMGGLRALGLAPHTTAERDALVGSADGHLIWNSDTGQIEVYDGGWGELTATGAISTVSDLTDTTITAPAVGQNLTWNGSAWTNQTPPSVASVSREADCDAGDAVGDCVYITGAEVGGKIQVEKVDVTDFAKMPACGIITSKPTSTTAVVHSLGFLDTSSLGIAGLTPGKPVFVGSSNKPSTTAPAAALAFVQEIGLAHDTDKIVHNPASTVSQNPA